VEGEHGYPPGGRPEGLELKIYLNAQFSDGKHRTHLLSVGMVSELGTFYRVARDLGAVRHGSGDQWIREHVFSRLPVDLDSRDWTWDEEHPDYQYIVSRDGLADDLLDYVDAHPEPEFWGWQSSYAYTCIRHLFGELTDRPANFPAWCGELAAKWSERVKPELPPRGVAGHHALEMAQWARDVDALLAE
jgi:hypothetical protein